MRAARGLGWATVLTLGAAACGSGGLISSTPTPKSLLDADQARTDPVVRVSSAGVAPQTSHLDAPVTVTFINDDAVAHRFEAALELGAGDCPEMALLETLEPGKRGTVTLSRSVSICGFHEAAAPGNMAFKGLIVVH
jgi:hypothetical protein